MWSERPTKDDKIILKISLHNVPLANREIRTALIRIRASDLMSGAFFQPYTITQNKALPKENELQ